MNNVLKQIESLENLSNRSAYDFKQSDIDSMIKTLKIAINNLEHFFNTKRKNNKFILKSRRNSRETFC